MKAEAIALIQRMRIAVASTFPLDRLGGEHADDAGLDERADKDEEPAEEEDGRPLDFGKHLGDFLLVTRRREEEQESCAGERNGRGLEPKAAVQDEERDREEDDGKALVQERMIRDLRIGRQAHNLILQLRLRMQFLVIKGNKDKLDKDKDDD